MEWKWYEDVEKFALVAEPLLNKREDLYSLFLGILGQLKDGRYEQKKLGVAEDKSGVAGVALMTAPHPLQWISFRDDAVAEESAAQNFHEAAIAVSGVIGDKKTAEWFAKAWSKQTGEQIQVAMDQGLYRIDAVKKKLPKSPGSWRVANRFDLSLLADWYQLFAEETAIGEASREEAEEKITDFIARKELFVWECGGEVVSCMKKARPSKHGVTVSFVYTPKPLRKNGYARTLVAEVTEELLLEYDFVMLYTDLANGTANKIYREIGYEQIANPVHLKFRAETRE